MDKQRINDICGDVDSDIECEESKNEKTAEEKISITVDVVNILAEKNCTVDEAREILNSAKWTIEHTTKVQKFNWKANSDNEKN